MKEKAACLTFLPSLLGGVVRQGNWRTGITRLHPRVQTECCSSDVAAAARRSPLNLVACGHLSHAYRSARLSDGLHWQMGHWRFAGTDASGCGCVRLLGRPTGVLCFQFVHGGESEGEARLNALESGSRGTRAAGPQLAVEFRPIIRARQVGRCASRLGVLRSSCCQDNTDEFAKKLNTIAKSSPQNYRCHPR